jgi:hypothetical protein
MVRSPLSRFYWDSLGFNTLKPRLKSGSDAFNLLCGRRPSAAPTSIYVYVLCTVHELNSGLGCMYPWVAWKLSRNSARFGAAIWGLLVALFRKRERSSISCEQSRCGLQFVLWVCCVNFRVFRKKRDCMVVS